MIFESATAAPFGRGGTRFLDVKISHRPSGGCATHPAHSAAARKPSANASGADLALVPARDGLGGADQREGRHDGEHEAQDVELPDRAGAQEPGDRAADERPDQPETQRREDAEVLTPRLEEPG